MAWLTGYSYRKKITITAQSGAGTNYQVKFLIGKASGATGENFDLGGHCLDSMMDMRFTSDNGSTQLSYWIESVAASGTSYLATVWVKVAADLSSSNQDIYCYYGKADATDGSNGENTFLFFDHFEGSSLDGDKWDTENTPSITVGSSTCKVLSNTLGWEGIYSKTTASACRFRGRVTQFYDDASNSDQSAIGLMYPQFASIATRDRGYFLHHDTAWNDTKVSLMKDNAGVTDSSEFSVGLPGIAEVLYDGSNVKANWDGTERLGSTSWAAGDQKVGLGGYDNGGHSSYVTADWVFLSKFVATEPAYSSAGSEETPTNIKSINGLVKTSVKSVNGLAIASVKSFNGLT